MKLHTEKTNIERGGVHAESAFTIKTNALSFSILSSGLYTDPEMAIVRELSCNAYDAHVAAGTADTPFEIHLPNDLEPWLSIKDYGVGLSDEDIRGQQVPVMRENDEGVFVEATDKNGNTIYKQTGGLYTTYFDSTKTDSNDYIGALGLGSKSPFSYTNAFEVISRHAGKKRTYAIFLNEEGIPTVAKMGEIDTDEHSGLEVRITIKPEHFNKFKEKTATALRFFPVKPKVTGTLNFEFDPIPKYRIETDKWMLSSIDYYMSSSMTAVQGNVAYRVNANQLKERLNSEIVDFASRAHIVMFFDIGDLEVSANREEIRYDEKSVDALINRMVELYDGFTNEVENQIGDIDKRYWYACMELNELSKKLFRREDSIRKFVDPNKVADKNLRRYIENNGDVSWKRLWGYEFKRYSFVRNYTNIRPSNLSGSFSPEPNEPLVLNDVKKGGLKRLAQWMTDKGHRTALVLTRRNEPLIEFDLDNNPVKYIGYEKEFARLLDELGNPDYIKVSEETEPLTTTRVSRELTFYRFNNTYSSRGTYYPDDKIKWTAISANIEDGGIFFPLKYGSTVCYVDESGELKEYSDNINIIIRSFDFIIDAYNKKYGKEESLDTIYGLPTGTYKKAIKNDKWVNIFDIAKEFIPEFIDELSFFKRKNATPNSYGIKETLTNKTMVKYVKNLDDRSAFKNAVMPIIKGAEAHKEKVLDNADIIEFMFHLFFADKEIDSTPFYDANAFKCYPMLTLIDDLSYNSDWKTFFDYIELIDRS